MLGNKNHVGKQKFMLGNKNHVVKQKSCWETKIMLGPKIKNQ